MKSTHQKFILRRSVVLLSTAILLSNTTNALTIGRLPSTSAGEQLVGAKPNVFLIVANSSHTTPNANGNFLQQTSAALISTLPVLEGKVRLGYTKGLPDVTNCSNLKLNGNVPRLLNNNSISGLADLAQNKNYVTGDDDFVFGNTGSGLGEIIPRDFQGNFARYIYSWIGAICPGKASDTYRAPTRWVPAKKKQPPYANLSTDPNERNAYRQAAQAAGNENSYPLWNYAGSQNQKKSFSPVGDRVVDVLGLISDRNFLSQIAGPNTCKSMNTCAGVRTSEENSGPSNTVLRVHPYYQYFKYDAYANAVYNDPNRDDGFPDDKNPLECRKNYIILINDGPISLPKNVSSNYNVGATYLNKPGDWSKIWNLPISNISSTSSSYGIGASVFPHNSDEVLPYRYIPNLNAPGVLDIPNNTIDGKVIQGGAGKFRFSKLAYLAYYSDLRSNLPNKVPAYYEVKETQHSGSIAIRKEWNRKNDSANWQHASFFALAYTPSFPSWLKATVYNDNYPDLNPNYPSSRSQSVREQDLTLEGYFRAIEDGSIRDSNDSLLIDWSRGGFAVSKYNQNPKNEGIYIYKRPNGTTEKYSINATPNSGALKSLDSFQQMDFAKAGIISRGGSYPVNDYDSVKKAIEAIASRIESAMAQEVSGTGAVGGGGRVTASAQAAGGNKSTLFTTYVDEATVSGNLFAFRNCPFIEKEKDGRLNEEWIKNQCGQRLWNAAKVLERDKDKIASKTIIATNDPTDSSKLIGKEFTWNNLDDAIKSELQKGGDEALGQARVEWLNGKTQTEFTDASVASKLRVRPTIQIPVEGQRYKLDNQGNPVKDNNGNYVMLEPDPNQTPNRIGEVVYATAKTVDPRGTLNAVHPLNTSSYTNFIKDKIREVKIVGGNTVIENKRSPLVIMGANDGRLYGFTNPSDGSYAELAFSYIPNAVATDGRLTNTTKTSWSPATAESLVNGPFTVMDAQVDDQWGTYLVGTLGAGGSTVYALDISDGTAKFKWEIKLNKDTDTAKAKANIMSPPRIVWLREPCQDSDPQNCAIKGKWVVLLPSGYNADDTSLVILDLKDGSILARIRTGADYESVATTAGNPTTQTCTLKDIPTDSDRNLVALHDKLAQLGNITLPKQGNISCDNGLGDLTVIDANGDSGADYVYAGDLLGNIWKFDLTEFNFNSNPTEAKRANDAALKVAYNSPIFIAETESKVRQPITSMIEIDNGPYGEGSMMYIGTGRLFNQQERSISQRQSFYAVWDNPRYTEITEFKAQLPLRRIPPATHRYGFWKYQPVKLDASNSTIANDSSLRQYDEIRTMVRMDNLPPQPVPPANKNVGATPDAYLSYDKAGRRINENSAQAMGWIVDFPENAQEVNNGNKERVLNRARTFEDMIFFSTFTPESNGETTETCEPNKPSVGGEGRFYMLGRLTGAPLEQAPFDFNGDGKSDKSDNLKVKGSVVGSKTTSVKADDNNNVSLSPASIKFDGSANFVELEAVLEQGQKPECDYTRQVMFPGTADAATGDPLTLTGCYQNRYRVWKQPVAQ